MVHLPELVLGLLGMRLLMYVGLKMWLEVRLVAAGLVQGWLGVRVRLVGWVGL